MAASSSLFDFTSPTLLLHPLSLPTTRPPADDLACSWILEFILRQPISDSIANEIFICLPFSSADLHPHLRKTLLIRRIFSDIHRRSLSERTLHSLELIAELDRHRGALPSNRLKTAYCTAAVECAATAYRRSRDDFLVVFQRIWLQEAAGDLVSDMLLDWGNKMEKCFSNWEGGEDIVKMDVSNSLKLVRDYLEEALEEMGPSFLEIAAAEMVEKKKMNVTGIVGKGASISNGTVACTPEKDLEKESTGLGDASKNQGHQFHGTVGSEFYHVEVEVESCQNDGSHEMPDNSRCKTHHVNSSEVSKVKGALRRSCFVLSEVVKDPLPVAQAVASAVLASMSLAHELSNEQENIGSEENPVLPVPPVQVINGVQTVVDADTGGLEKEKTTNLSDLQQIGDHVLKECNKEARPCKKRGFVDCKNLFERNSTAHTCEWSESSLESPVSMEKAQSSKSRKKIISPIRLEKGMKAKRRAVKRWAPLEEQTLREAVAKHGKGNWKLILSHNSEIFEERTEVDLKDKWRNLARHLV